MTLLGFFAAHWWQLGAVAFGCLMALAFIGAWCSPEPQPRKSAGAVPWEDGSSIPEWVEGDRG